MGKDICNTLRENVTDAVTRLLPYKSYIMTDYDGNKFMFGVTRFIAGGMRSFNLDFARPGEKLKTIATICAHEKTTDKHIVNQLTSMILDWVSKTRIKPKADQKKELIDIYAKSVKKVYDNYLKLAKDLSVTFGVEGGYVFTFTISKTASASIDVYELSAWADCYDERLSIARVFNNSDSDISIMFKRFGTAIYEKIAQMKRCENVSISDLIKQKDDICEDADGDDLVNAAEKCSEAMKKLGNVDISYPDYEQKYWDCQRRIDEYERDFRDKDDIIENQKRLIKYLRERCDRLAYEKQTTEMNFSKARSDLRELNSRIRELEEKNHSLSDEYEREREEFKKVLEIRYNTIHELASEKQAKIDKNKQLQQANDNQKKIIHDMTERIVELGSRIKELEEKNYSLSCDSKCPGGCYYVTGRYTGKTLYERYFKEKAKHYKATQKCKAMAKEIDELNGRVKRLDERYCNALRRNKDALWILGYGLQV